MMTIPTMKLALVLDTYNSHKRLNLSTSYYEPEKLDRQSLQLSELGSIEIDPEAQELQLYLLDLSTYSLYEQNVAPTTLSNSSYSPIKYLLPWPKFSLPEFLLSAANEMVTGSETTYDGAV